MGLFSTACFEGEHGTSRLRAEAIVQHGFKIVGLTGYAGDGVYFWFSPRYARALAIAWFKKCLNRGDYSGENSPECSVLRAEISAQKDQCVDLKDHRIIDLLERKASSLKGNLGREGKASFFNGFIDELERTLRSKILVVHTQVDAPDNLCYPSNLIGKPRCLVARDAACIRVIEHVKVDS